MGHLAGLSRDTGPGIISAVIVQVDVQSQLCAKTSAVIEVHAKIVWRPLLLLIIGNGMKLIDEYSVLENIVLHIGHHVI